MKMRNCTVRLNYVIIHYFHSFNKNRQKKRKLFSCSFSVRFISATPYTQVAGLIMHLKCSIKCLEDARSIISALAYKTVGGYSSLLRFPISSHIVLPVAIHFQERLDLFRYKLEEEKEYKLHFWFGTIEGTVEK
ncbi:uncharacterized protein LOC115975628 isoform X2 [Quercus lobata]|uniref:uncharacterized protein LOC115975628 isoform X2 n=1 Tax=Quercus lobata TaxID=97700 RepID=UPI0012471B91|nr:uncharacterized protein LOC115975628 isoform X2 [Quercus lobata]